MGFKELNVSYINKGMGSKGRANNHRPTGIQNSFLTEMENVVVLIESMRNIVMESPQNMFLCLLSKLKHRSGLFLDPHCRASLNCVKNMTLTKKQRELLLLLEPEGSDTGLIKGNQKHQQISIVCQQKPGG